MPIVAISVNVYKCDRCPSESQTPYAVLAAGSMFPTVAFDTESIICRRCMIEILNADSQPPRPLGGALGGAVYATSAGGKTQKVLACLRDFPGQSIKELAVLVYGEVGRENRVSVILSKLKRAGLATNDAGIGRWKAV